MLDTTNLTEVVRFIVESDDSFYKSPKRLIYGVRDLYTGNQLIKEDFISLIKLITPLLNEGYLRIKDIVNILQQNSKRDIFFPILKDVYVNHDCKELCSYEHHLQAAYTNKTSLLRNRNRDCNHSIQSSIVYFRTEYTKKFIYGEIIKIEWECVNPVIIILSAGKQAMDVSGLSSLCISALYDSYELLIQDLDGTVIDKKSLIIEYKTIFYCINCGCMIRDSEDIYCTHCGVRVYHD